MSSPFDNVVIENHDDIDSDSDSGAPILEPLTKEEQRAIRAELRELKAAETHAKAEVFRRMGDELFDKKKYEEALIPYLEASRIWPSNVSYYIVLSLTYSRLQWFEEAAHAATRALTLDPRSTEARYTRALARLEQRLLTAAKTDLEIVVNHEPTHEKAKGALTEVKKALEAGTKLGSHEIAEPAQSSLQGLDFSYPDYDDDPLELDTLSNSSDCHHRGNGVPCRFYNRGRCGKGVACLYSHAPDEKSVRDDLGHNVCIYFLLDNCRFGDTKCVYSHSKECLPSRGWWTDPEKTAKIKSIVELTEKTAKEQRSLAHTFHKRQARASALSKLKSTASKEAKTPNTEKTEERPKSPGEKENEEKSKQEEKADGEVEKKTKPRRHFRPRRGGKKAKASDESPAGATTENVVTSEAKPNGTSETA